jgi:hypothetical protein
MTPEAIKARALDATKVTFIFESLEEAAVSMTDFSRLTNISRTSLYAWKRGNTVSDHLRLNLAFNTALRISKAVEANRLPLTEKLSSSERLRALRAVITTTNREMRG